MPDLEQIETGITIDADGVITNLNQVNTVEAEPGRRGGRGGFVPAAPKLMEAALEGAIQSLKRIAESIAAIDVLISTYADLLARAQPLNSGRVVVVFAKSHRVQIDSAFHFDLAPVVMCMVRFHNGRWKLMRPTKQFSKLEELRVGRDLPSDRLVVRLLRQLDELLATRKVLVGFLRDFRTPASCAVRSANGIVNASFERLPKLKDRLRLDWMTDAKGCRESVRHDRAQRRQRLKPSLDSQPEKAEKTVG